VTFTYCQDGVTGSDLSFILKQKNLEEIYEKVIFKALDIRQKKLVIPERWGENRS
jgi:hypothetical protein